jgi:hypothetical protein
VNDWKSTVPKNWLQHPKIGDSFARTRTRERSSAEGISLKQSASVEVADGDGDDANGNDESKEEYSCVKGWGRMALSSFMGSASVIHLRSARRLPR